VKPVGRMSLAELAAYVCSHLRKHGIRVVLSGGACVSIYTQNRYQSYDLDFVENPNSFWISHPDRSRLGMNRSIVQWS
jgi:hypothetical protein